MNICLTLANWCRDDCALSLFEEVLTRMQYFKDADLGKEAVKCSCHDLKLGFASKFMSFTAAYGASKPWFFHVTLLVDVPANKGWILEHHISYSFMCLTDLPLKNINGPFLVLGIELRALHVLGEYFPIGWYHHPCSDFFWYFFHSLEGYTLDLLV